MLGFNLIEMLIGLAVLGILMMVGLPELNSWMQSTQVRNSAESIVSALQLSRTEALRRNLRVQFTLTDTLTADCAPSFTGTDWVVSLADPSAACDAVPSDTVAPQILQKRSGQEGSGSATVTATGSWAIVFDGLGHIVGFPVGGVLIDIGNLTAACQPVGGGDGIRCLRVVLSASGAICMCDPAVPVVVPPTQPRPLRSRRPQKGKPMKPSFTLLAASLMFVAANASSSAPRENRPAAAPATLSGLLLPAWLLAQDRRMPSCQMDGREVPVGTTYCRQQRVWSCERSGWTNTGNPC